MERRKKLILLWILVILFVGILSACNQSSVTSLTPKGEAVSVEVGKSFPILNYFTYEGNGTFQYTVEGTDIISQADGIITGLSVGKAKVTVTSGGLSASIVVYVVKDSKVIDITVSDTKTVYDGTQKQILTTASLPEGGSLKYYDGENKPFHGATDAGVYSVRVDAVLPEGYIANFTDGKDTASLTVDKAVYPVEHIKFPSATYDYDGTEKSLAIVGALPAGVSVQYQNHKGTDAGEYLATAKFIGEDTKNYELIVEKKAKLTIHRISFDLKREGFTTTAVTYDGTAKMIQLGSLPDGLSVKYYHVVAGAEDAEITTSTKFINAGKYRIKAVFSYEEVYVKNYNHIQDMEVELTINKANFRSDNLKWNTEEEFTYTGNQVTIGTGAGFSFGLIGTLPQGVNGEYAGQIGVRYRYRTAGGSYVDVTDFTDAGSYIIYAVFQMPVGSEVNYNELAPYSATLTINRARYNMTGVTLTGGTYTFDNVARQYKIDVSAESEFSLSEVTVKYFLTGNSGVADEVEEISLLNAGKYKIEARFFLKQKESNYHAIPTLSAEVVINKLEVDISEVQYADVGTVYDGALHMPVISNLTAGLAAQCTPADGKRTAGVYTYTAAFSYALNASPVASGNYVLMRNGVAVKQLTATLTIAKAAYTEGTDFLKSSYFTVGGVYAPDKKLQDYAIQNALGKVFWAEPSTVPTVHITSYLAYYNADPENYVNCTFMLPLSIEKATIDGDLITVKDQFLPYTGKTVIPVFSLGGTDANALQVEYLTETAPVARGTYVVDMTFSLVDSVNYRIRLAGLDVASVERTGIKLYIYDGSKFIYEGTQLRGYKGTEFEVEIPEGTTSIYANALKNNLYIANLTVPNTVTAIGGGAFAGMSSLHSLTLPFIGRTATEGTFAELFSVSSLSELSAAVPLRVVKVTNTETVRREAFYLANGIQSIAYTMQIFEVGDSAFAGCSALKSLSLDYTQSVTVGKDIVLGCTALTELVLPFLGSDAGTAKLFSYFVGISSATNIYSNYSLTKLSFQYGFTTLLDGAFKGFSAPNFSELVLPDTVSAIGKEAFSGMYAAVALNGNFTAVTANMFEGYAGKSVILPSAIVRIESAAFYNARNTALSITLPSKVTYIGANAFNGVRGNIAFSAGSTIAVLSEKAFYGYAGASLVLPPSVTEIGANAFQNTRMAAMTLGANVVTLGKELFLGNTALETVTLLTPHVTTGMFEGCTNLSEVKLAVGTIELGSRAFFGCSMLQTVTLPASLQRIRSYAFYNCSRLWTLSLPQNVSAIDDYAFGKCTTFYSLTINRVQPPAFGGNVFIETSSALLVYVPREGYTDYKNNLALAGLNIREI